MELLGKRSVLKTHPFEVEELRLARDGKELAHPYHRLVAPDWVNVLPLTSDGRAILIRQERSGVMRKILEVPGGVIEAGERDPTLTAARELEEETGFTSQRILSLGAILTNPAIMTNRCHFFLALDCQLPSERRHFPDADEQIEIELVPVADLDSLVRTGRIDHALSALSILLAAPYLKHPGQHASP